MAEKAKSSGKKMIPYVALGKIDHLIQKSKSCDELKLNKSDITKKYKQQNKEGASKKKMSPEKNPKINKEVPSKQNGIDNEKKIKAVYSKEELLEYYRKINSDTISSDMKNSETAFSVIGSLLPADAG